MSTTNETLPETTVRAGRRITLTTPIKREDLEGIRVGDVIFLDGHIVTCRDVAHRRLIELGRELPVDIREGAILPGRGNRSSETATGYTPAARNLAAKGAL